MNSEIVKIKLVKISCQKSSKPKASSSSASSSSFIACYGTDSLTSTATQSADNSIGINSTSLLVASPTPASKSSLHLKQLYYINTQQHAAKDPGKIGNVAAKKGYDEDDDLSTSGKYYSIKSTTANFIAAQLNRRNSVKNENNYGEIVYPMSLSTFGRKQAPQVSQQTNMVLSVDPILSHHSSLTNSSQSVASSSMQRGPPTTIMSPLRTVDSASPRMRMRGLAAATG